MPQSAIVPAFKGLLAGRRKGLISERRPLDTPRELLNLLVDDDGHLWMPPAPVRIDSTVPGSGEIVQILWTVVGSTLVQRGTKVYASNRLAGSVTHPEQWVFLADVGSELPVWVTNHGYSDPNIEEWVYFGNRSGTWKYRFTSDTTATVTNLTTPLAGFHGWASTMHLGRRFVAGGGLPGQQNNQRVYFSGIDQPETFDEEDFINVGGGSTGKDSSSFPGEVTGFAIFEHTLLIVCAGSLWTLTGSSVETFHLRRIVGDIGSQGRTGLHYHTVPDGMLFLGGERAGEMGVYLFTGGSARKVSSDIDAFFQRWQSEYDDLPAVGDQAPYVRVRHEIGRWANAVRFRGFYVLSFGPADPDRQVYVYNLRNRAWSTFDGWGPGPALGVQHDYYMPQRVLIGKGDTVHESLAPFPRASGRPAKFTIGWSDEERPAGLVRFLGVKVRGWKQGSGVPTLKITARTDLSDPTEVSVTSALPNGVFENLILPINIRGAGIELDFEITPANDNNEVLIEGLELIMSRKGDKLSRP
jgi:hypothetical protein